LSPSLGKGGGRFGKEGLTPLLNFLWGGEVKIYGICVKSHEGGWVGKYINEVGRKCGEKMGW
jgi:hypothetical protein